MNFDEMEIIFINLSYLSGVNRKIGENKIRNDFSFIRFLTFWNP